MQAAALVGRGVLVEGKKLTTEAGAVGGFELDAAADSVVLSIKDAAGLEIKKIELADVKAGSQNLSGDGTASDGSRRSTRLHGRAGSARRGKKVTGRTLEFGPVTSDPRRLGYRLPGRLARHLQVRRHQADSLIREPRSCLFQQGLSGLSVSSKALDIISNNVANTNTIGF